MADRKDQPIYHYYMDPSESYMIWVKAFIGGMFVGSILGLNLCFALLVGYFVFSTKTEFFREKIINCLNHYQASVPVAGTLSNPLNSSISGLIGDTLRRGVSSSNLSTPPGPPGPPPIPPTPSIPGGSPTSPEGGYNTITNLLFPNAN